MGMNEDTNFMAAALIALSQIQSLKEKLDPEVFELLNKSGHEAISSAHHFLDACEKALDSFSSEQSVNVELDLVSNEEVDNIVNLTSREA